MVTSIYVNENVLSSRKQKITMKYLLTPYSHNNKTLSKCYLCQPKSNLLKVQRHAIIATCNWLNPRFLTPPPPTDFPFICIFSCPFKNAGMNFHHSYHYQCICLKGGGISASELWRTVHEVLNGYHEFRSCSS